MKNLSLLLFALLSFQFAHTQDRIDEATNYAADYICTCVNKVYAAVDEDVREVIMSITMVENQAEIDEYIATLSEDLTLRIAEQSEFMQKAETIEEMNACSERMMANLDSKYGNVAEESGITEEEVMQKILARLESREGCEFTYFLVLVGLLSEENVEEPVINNNNNNNNNGLHGGGGTDGQ